MFTGLQDHRKVQTGRNLRRSHSSTSCTKQSLQWFTFPHTFRFWCLNHHIDTWLEVPNWEEEVLAVNNQLHPVQICAFMLWNDGMLSWGSQLLKPLLCLTLSWKLCQKKGSFCCPPPHAFQSRIRNLVINHFKTVNASGSDSCLNLLYLKTEMLPHQKMKFRATSLQWMASSHSTGNMMYHPWISPFQSYA